MTHIEYESDIKHETLGEREGWGGGGLHRALKLSVANIIGGQMREAWEIQ